MPSLKDSVRAELERIAAGETAADQRQLARFLENEALREASTTAAAAAHSQVGGTKGCVPPPPGSLPPPV